MGGADQEVFMNRNRNARANELGIYFGAMPLLLTHHIGVMLEGVDLYRIKGLQCVKGG